MIARAALLLGVDGEVLGHGHHMLGLDGAHFRAGGAGDQERILAQALGEASEMPGAGEVQRRTAKPVPAVVSDLLTQKLAIQSGRVGVEGRGDRQRGGEGGDRHPAAAGSGRAVPAAEHRQAAIGQPF